MTDTTSPTTVATVEDQSSEGRSAFDTSGNIALAVVATAWVVILGLMLTRKVFISHDSLSNNVHVWFIGEQLWSGHGLPFHMPILASGKAYTFPYASIPWALAGLLWPILGDWVVTLWLVLGFVGTVAATFWAFPTLRRGWWAAATLANPALVISPLLGQLPFLWAMAAFITAIGFWRRGRTGWAIALTAVSTVIHPAVMTLVVATIVLLDVPFEKPERRRALIGGWLLTIVISLPAMWLVMQSPVVAQTSRVTQVAALFQTAGMRLVVVMGPIVLVLLARYGVPKWTPAVLTVLFIGLQFGMYQPFGMDFAWGALWRTPDSSVDAFVDSDRVVEGDTYRVLSGFDGKYGLYAVTRAGGTLDAEFFPEALHRGGFGTEGRYVRFLNDRAVQHVVAFDSYVKHYRRTNEPAMLARMAADGRCVDGTMISRAGTGRGWQLYDVTPC